MRLVSEISKQVGIVTTLLGDRLLPKLMSGELNVES